MNISFNRLPQSASRNVNFEGQVDLKLVNKALRNGADAQALHHFFVNDTYDLSKANLKVITDAYQKIEKPIPRVQYYFQDIIARIQKQLGISG